MGAVKRRAVQRDILNRALRQFFYDRGFTEVDTPVAISAPAPEACIDPLAVDLVAAETTTSSKKSRRYLQPSPELAMKRLLAAGMESIFQISPVFRDGDYSRIHCPEFRLLEWYRRDRPWQDLLTDCEELLGACSRALPDTPHSSISGLNQRFRRITMDEAFQTWAGFSILDNLTTGDLSERLHERQITFTAETDTWDDLFHRAFLTLVEPRLAEEPAPLFVTHYPAPLCALARLDADDPRCCERFELFIHGVELANGYGELTDQAEQRRRFEDANTLRRQRNAQVFPLDARFLSDLDGIDSAAGIALGVDRLLMLLTGAASIAETAPIPWDEC